MSRPELEIELWALIQSQINQWERIHWHPLKLMKVYGLSKTLNFPLTSLPCSVHPLTTFKAGKGGIARNKLCNEMSGGHWKGNWSFLSLLILRKCGKHKCGNNEMEEKGEVWMCSGIWISELISDGNRIAWFSFDDFITPTSTKRGKSHKIGKWNRIKLFSDKVGSNSCRIMSGSLSQSTRKC